MWIKNATSDMKCTYNNGTYTYFREPVKVIYVFNCGKETTDLKEFHEGCKCTKCLEEKENLNNY